MTRRYCPKCFAISGDSWIQCGGACPVFGSPFFDQALNSQLGGLIDGDPPARIVMTYERDVHDDVIPF